MSPMDVLWWCAAVIGLAMTSGIVLLIGTIATREMFHQWASLNSHRARCAMAIAQAKAAEQQAELEAADALSARIALPFGQTTSRADELAQRLDRLEADVIQAHAATDRAAAAVTHTSTPLAPGRGQW
jgi:hypothetical protein